MFTTLKRIDLGILSCVERWVTHPIERTFGITNFMIARGVVLLLLCMVYFENMILADITVLRGVAMLIALLALFCFGAIWVANTERETLNAMRKKCATPMKAHAGISCVRILLMFITLPLCTVTIVARGQWWDLFALYTFIVLILLVSIEPLPPGSESRLKKLLRKLFPRRARTA